MTPTTRLFRPRTPAFLLVLAVLGALVLAGSPLEAASGPTGGDRGLSFQGGHGQPGAGQPGASGTPGGKGTSGPAADRQRSAQARGTGPGSPGRAGIALSSEQRDRVRDNRQMADRVVGDCKELRKETRSATFRADRARPSLDRTRDGIHSMLRDHDRLMASLSDRDRARWNDRLHDRLQTLSQARERMNTCLSRLDRQLGEPRPSQSRVSAEVRELNRAVKTWRKAYRRVAEDLGVPPRAS